VRISLVFISQVFFTLNFVSAHSGADPAEEWTDKFYRNFIRYHKDIEHINSGPIRSEAFIKIGSQKFPLNNDFYELMRLSLRSVAQEYNEFCDTCLVEEVKKKSQDRTWIQNIESKIDSITEMRAAISGVKREYGNMALVGYLMMEMLEHTFLGPLGVCPILNVVYFSSLDVIKSMVQSFRFSRDFRLLGVPSITQSIQLGMRIFLFKKRASKILYEFHPQMRKSLSNGNNSEVTAKHLSKKFNFWIFWKKDSIDRVSVSNREYRKLSKRQGRLRWLYWQTELQSLYSRRLLWPIAYQELILDPSLTSEEGTFNISKNGPLNFSHEIAKVFSLTENPEARLASALFIHEYFFMLKKMMIHLLKEDMENKRITRQQFLESYKDLSAIAALKAEFANYLLAASLQKKDSSRFQSAFDRAKRSLDGMQGLIPILESWFLVSDNFDRSKWQKVQDDLIKWHDQELLSRPWMKPKITLWNRAKACGAWLSDKLY